MEPVQNPYDSTNPNSLNFVKPVPKSPVVESFPVSDDTLRSKKAWRPWTLTAKVLVPTAIFTALLIVALALLQWQNARHGALFFAQTEDGFSHMVLFLYRYLPTIIFVLYGVVWSWIDLDIKRLEPWFQMAQPNGADGATSLLLQYPMEFLPLVPYKAARKKWVSLLYSRQLSYLIPIQAVGSRQRVNHYADSCVGSHTVTKWHLHYQRL
jgi:Protein of unknown function (DUF3433)